jgi:hypothetical protein
MVVRVRFSELRVRLLGVQQGEKQTLASESELKNN